MKNKRREFLKKSGLAGLSFLVGANIVFANRVPSNFTPVLSANDPWYELFGKDKELVLLNDKPWNAETPPHLLDDFITPASKFFMRNNGTIPKITNTDDWKIKFEGESVKAEQELTLEFLKKNFKHYTYHLTIECGGNGRAEFYPPASGNQWTTGAVACAKWTGVRMKDVLNYIGIKSDAVYVAYYSADKHLSGDSEKAVISRGVPLAKAMEDETLLAFAMNGEDIPVVHGFPLRMVAGGWPGSVSGKWINKITVRNKVHDGPKMTGSSYRVPCTPVSPGSDIDDENMCIIESMPVKSLITYPKTGALVKPGQKFEVRGKAWAGDYEVSKVDISIDFGATWQKCKLEKPLNRLGWQQWTSEVSVTKKGYFEVWAKATDSNGVSQPMVVPGWNPKGYLNNACHRIAFKTV